MTHDGRWVAGRSGSAYDVDNLPYGVFSDAPAREPRVGVRIGDHVLDAVGRWARRRRARRRPALNPLMALGRATWDAHAGPGWSTLLTDDEHRGLVEPQLVPVDRRDDAPAVRGRRLRRLLLLAAARHQRRAGSSGPTARRCSPNWRHLPVGYHGRAGTVVVSGTDVRRPVRPARAAARGHRRPSGRRRRLDIEAELGFVVGAPQPARASRVPTAAFADHVFGVTPLNDWSARDIQAWEYVPLGPFLGKSFATSISAVGHPAGTPWRRPGCRCPARTRSRWTTSAVDRARRPRHRLRGRCSTARWSAGRRTPRCTGRRPRCSPT